MIKVFNPFLLHLPSLSIGKSFSLALSVLQQTTDPDRLTAILRIAAAEDTAPAGVVTVVRAVVVSENPVETTVTSATSAILDLFTQTGENETVEVRVEICHCSKEKYDVVLFVTVACCVPYRVF